MNQICYMVVIFASIMEKVLRFILTLMLVSVLWHLTGDVSAQEKAGMETHLPKSVSSAVHVAHSQPEDSCIKMPVQPILPEAELANAVVQLQLLTSFREKRLAESVFSLKEQLNRLSQHEATLSLHREKLYHTTTDSQRYPVCEYYVFTLRKILI